MDPTRLDGPLSIARCLVALAVCASCAAGCHPLLDVDEYPFPDTGPDLDGTSDGTSDATDVDVSPSDLISPDLVSSDVDADGVATDVPVGCEGLCPDGTLYQVFPGPDQQCVMPTPPPGDNATIAWCEVGAACAAVCIFHEPCPCGVSVAGGIPSCTACVATCGDGVCEPSEAAVGCVDCPVPAPLEQSLAVGTSHTCAVGPAGLWCWGENRDGQLGTPASGIVNAPAVAVGSRFTCVVGVDAKVRCVGKNDKGQLGTPAPGTSAPAVVALPEPAVQVVAGEAHACALGQSGNVTCWGDNTAGQLGVLDAPGPAPVEVLQGVRALAAGPTHTCAVLQNGTAACWGANSEGALGNGTFDNRTPSPVVELSGVSRISAGTSHSCALLDSGQVWCWGGNRAGQLVGIEGGGTTMPVEMLGVGPAIDVSAGEAHTCVVSVQGDVWCWGRNPRSGVPMDTVPNKVAGLADVIDVESAGGTTCARLGNGEVRCWGDNGWGQAGVPVLRRALSPMQVPGVAGASFVSTGDQHTCVVQSGIASCWGANGWGQLGEGGLGWGRAVPAPINGPTDVVGVAAGPAHTCADTATHGIWCWGANHSAQGAPTGGTPASGTPSAIEGLSAGRVQAGGTSYTESHSCALATAGAAARCWGANAQGQLGATASSYELAPGPLGGFSSTPMAMLALGGTHTCGVSTAGELFCAGTDLTSTYTVADGALLTGVASASAGRFHSCAATTTGGLQCWGANFDGQLGDGTLESSLVPKQVAGLTDVAEVAASPGMFAHTCARTSTGALYCWGANQQGQLGLGNTSDATSPALVSALSGVVQVDVGDSHTCARTAASEVWCWGENLRGQLGDASKIVIAQPRLVALQ